MTIAQKLRGVSIGPRLGIAFGALILLMLASGWLGLFNLHDKQVRLESVYNNRVVPLQQL